MKSAKAEASGASAFHVDCGAYTRIHSKAFDSAESVLDSYETCFAPFWHKTETQNAVLFQIKRNRFI